MDRRHSTRARPHRGVNARGAERFASAAEDSCSPGSAVLFFFVHFLFLKPEEMIDSISSTASTSSIAGASTAPTHDVAVNWEALEDAFENNAPEVHSYMHLATGDVLRIVDGVADPHMHGRIAADTAYLTIEPVSSREQYRWMERFIPTVEEDILRGKLNQAIDGKGAFRRFKDVLMGYTAERERWFTFRSERLRTFMEAWLNAHAVQPVARQEPVEVAKVPGETEPESGPPSGASVEEAPKSIARRMRTPEQLRTGLREAAELLGPRDLEMLTAFAEFLRSRRNARSFAHHFDYMHGGGEPAPQSQRFGSSGPESMTTLLDMQRDDTKED